MTDNKGDISRPSMKPSDLWSDYSDSKFSNKHLTAKDKQSRTATLLFTTANMAKLYVGIAVISVSKLMSRAGIYTGIVGIIYFRVYFRTAFVINGSKRRQPKFKFVFVLIS